MRCLRKAGAQPIVIATPFLDQADAGGLVLTDLSQAKYRAQCWRLRTCGNELLVFIPKGTVQQLALTAVLAWEGQGPVSPFG